jgi:hypothetical protein
MNMKTRLALANMSASLVALTNHVEAGRAKLTHHVNHAVHCEGLTNLRSEEDPSSKKGRALSGDEDAVQ